MIDTYQQRLDDRRRTVEALDARSARLSVARVVLALSVPAAWFLLPADDRVWSAVPAVAFLLLIVIHARLLNRLERAQRAVAYYEAGLRRLTHAWMGTGDEGLRFADAEGTEQPHLYARDLDLFGRGSAFELLGTCRTEAGQWQLAQWLRAPAPPEDIRLRQQAIQELAPLLDLRERLSVEGDTIAEHLHPSVLRTWATAPRLLPVSTALSLAVACLPIAVVSALIWRINGGPAGLFEMAILVQCVVALALHRHVVRVIGKVDTPARNLDLLVHTTQLIEDGTFSSPRLVAIQQRLRAHEGRAPASAAIRHLSRLDALVASRRNVMFAPFAAVLLWGTQLAFRIEAWRRRQGPHIPDWLDALGEFEALAAMAGYAAEHPAYVYPTVFDTGPAQFSATALAHPLLSDEAVSNDVALGNGAPVLLLVSGSNMSGKSTFLRSIGLAVVFAQMGAPVRAQACALSPLAIGASIRVSDSLLDGQSRFYAEILRLRQVVDLARASNGRMLFLLDEMLSGTNSHDRRQGAEGILRGLTRLGAIGLATTHDLALGAIAESLAQAAGQRHFSDRFDAGTLEFDYVLRPGPVQTSNALALMRSVGLEVDVS